MATRIHDCNRWSRGSRWEKANVWKRSSMWQSLRLVEGIRGRKDSAPCTRIFHEGRGLTRGVVEDLHDGVELLQTNHCSSWVWMPSDAVVRSLCVTEEKRGVYFGTFFLPTFPSLQACQRRGEASDCKVVQKATKSWAQIKKNCQRPLSIQIRKEASEAPMNPST